MTKRMMIDGHLDLALNAMEWNRDLKTQVTEIRERESGMKDKLDRGKGVVSLPQLREGGIGLVFATQIARYVAPENQLPGWNSPEQAWAQTQGQLAWYRAMEDEDEMKQITNRKTLNELITLWKDRDISDEEKPIGYVLSLEGADSLITLNHLHKAYGYGLRAIGPAHYGPGRYADGTGTDGEIHSSGKELIQEMDRLHMALDITHLTDSGFWQAMKLFKGVVWASHHNCRSLVNHQRQLTDDQIKALAEREAVIGGALDAWMLSPKWVRGISDPRKSNVNLEKLIDHYDHICQLTGNCDHIAIGTDLDGMFGKEQSPYDLETIADLTKLENLLQVRGYNTEQMDKIFFGNWLRLLERILV